MDVTKTRVFAIFFVTLTFAGCKEPDVQMASLGRALPAPALKGTSPFDQELEGTGYVRIQGTCDKRVKGLVLSFDKTNWHQPSQSPDLTDTSLPAGTTNDTDCSDGSFDVYLTKPDLTNIWGIVHGSSWTDVDYIYIKGSTPIGYTEILTIKDTNSSNGQATQVAIQKERPRGFAGADRCGFFKVYPATSSGDRATHTADVTFQVSRTGGGTTVPGIQAYKSMSDCETGENIQATFTIPAQQDNVEVYYRFPSAPIDSTFEFTVVNPSALAPSPSKELVTLRDPATTKRWLEVEDHFDRIYKDKCYRLRFRSRDYQNNFASDPFDRTLDLSSTSGNVKFYSAAGCGGGNETSSFSISAYSSVGDTWVKYNSPGNEGTLYIDFSVSVTNPALPAVYHDFSAHKIKVDLSAHALATKIAFWGPRNIENGQCERYRVITMNSNGTPLPMGVPITSALATQQADVGNFYSDNECLPGNEQTTAEVSSGEFSKEVFFKPSASVSGDYQFNVTASGLSNQNEGVYVKSEAKKFTVNLASWVAGGCTKVTVGLADNADIAKTATQIYSGNINTASVLAGRVYEDHNCTILKASNDITILSGMSNNFFYIDSSGLAGNGAFIFVTDGSTTPTLSQGSVSGTFN